MALTNPYESNNTPQNGSIPNFSSMGADPYALAASQVANFGFNWYNKFQQIKNINTNVNASQSDASGKPIYNLGNDTAKINAINPQGAQLQDYALGAFSPAGLIATGFLGGAAKRAAEARKRIAQQNLMAAQRTYNANMMQFNNQQLGQQEYLDQQNPEARMYNLSKFTTPYS